MTFSKTSWLLTCIILLTRPALAAPRSDGQLVVELVDAETGQPIVARMHLKNSRGRPDAREAASRAGVGAGIF
jgi:hypothetical protein